MLSRRFLRIKTMQALYSYSKNENPDLTKSENELLKGIEQVYDLYLLILELLGDIHHQELMIIEEHRNKRLPKPEDLNPNLKFIENRVFKFISESENLKKAIESNKLGVRIDEDLVRRLLNQFKKTDAYINYVNSPESNLEEDKKLIINLISEVLVENEVLTSVFEEKNIYWSDDLHVSYHLVIKTVENSSSKLSLVPLYKDEKDDKLFVKELFKNTIHYKNDFTAMIKEHVKNWEMERIAEMDMLLMQMCIAEFLYLPFVPVKASLNEYIDISKEYSTPNSKVFINGILDKIVLQLKRSGRIAKEGRGLKES